MPGRATCLVGPCTHPGSMRRSSPAGRRSSVRPTIPASAQFLPIHCRRNGAKIGVLTLVPGPRGRAQRGSARRQHRNGGGLDRDSSQPAGRCARRRARRRTSKMLWPTAPRSIRRPEWCRSSCRFRSPRLWCGSVPTRSRNDRPVGAVAADIVARRLRLTDDRQEPGEGV